jgi:hypothetical protein
MSKKLEHKYHLMIYYITKKKLVNEFQLPPKTYSIKTKKFFIIKIKEGKK